MVLYKTIMKDTIFALVLILIATASGIYFNLKKIAVPSGGNILEVFSYETIIMVVIGSIVLIVVIIIKNME